MKNNLQTPTKCECGNDKFYVELLDNWDTEKEEPELYCIGVLYQCTECGYINTAWRD